MACIYIINGKKFSEIDQSAIDELIKADLIEPNSAKTIAMAYQIAKEDNTNPDFTDKIDAILNNSPQQSEQTQDTPQAEVKTETPKESETTTTPSSSPSSEVSAPNNVEIKTYDDIKKVAAQDKEFSAEKGNKIVEKDGTPMVVYHNTNANELVRNGEVGEMGVFFTPRKESYSDYGDTKYAAVLDIKKPYYTSQGVQLWQDKINRIKSEGYDAIITHNNYQYEKPKGVTPEEYAIVQNKYNNVEGYDNRNELDLSKAQEIIVFDKNKIKEIATVNNKTGEIKQSKTNSQNEPSTIKSNIPSSDKGTQVTEPTIKESETKVDQEEKIPIGETAETPTTKETKTDESPVFDDKNWTNVPVAEVKPTTEEKIAKAEKSIDEVADLFKKKLGFLIVPSDPNIKTSGITLDQLIDVVAQAAKQFAKGAIVTSEHIKQAIDFLKENDILGEFDEKEIEAKAKEALKSDVEKATEKVEALSDDQKEVVDEITIAENDEQILQGVKGFIDSMNRSEKLTQKEKDEMNERLGRNYDVLSNAKLEVIGKAIIEELGGLDKALVEAQNMQSDMLPYVRTFILGQAIIENRKLEQNAVTQEAKNKYADIQIDLFDKLDNLARNYGRAIQALTKLYTKSNLAVVRKAKKVISERNGAKQIEAEQQAENINEAISDGTDNETAANEALQDLLNNEKEKVKELEAAYEKLKKEINNPNPPKSNGKKRDFGSSKDKKATIKRLRENNYNASRRNIIPIAAPQLIQDLNDLVLGYMEEGFYEFEDVQKKLKKDLGGRHSEFYAEAYEKAKESAIEKGAKENEFTSTEKVNEILDKQQEESDAAKLAKASAKTAKAKGNAPQTIAKRIINDAKNFLNGVTTKKEGELINKLIAKVSAMARDKYKSKLMGKTSPNDLLLFAIENKKEGKELFDAAQKEVNDIIKNDNKLSDAEKQSLNDFLENYKKSIFDALLTNKNKDFIVKETLIKLGYTTLDSKGNVIVDLKGIALSKNKPKEAIEKLKKIIIENAGVEQSEIEDLLTALEQKFNELILAKKEAKINSVLNANDRYKASLQIKYKERKDKIRSLIELYNAGGLTNEKILEKLARDLGIVAFTDNDQNIIEDLLERIDNAPTGFIAAGLEEELQAYFENIGGTFAMKEFFERLRARLLSGFITSFKNLTGFFDTAAMIGQQFLASNSIKGVLKGDVDFNVFKVIGQAQRIGGVLALESFVNGSVDNGSAFSEQTGQKEGTPNVRFLEFQQYHNYWKTNIPVLKQLLQGVQAFKKNEKYVQRVLGATDSVNHTILQEMKSYTFTKKHLMKNNPNLSEREAANEAFRLTYALDITEATKAASEIYQEQGMDIAKNKKAFNKLVYKLATNASLIEARNQAIKEFDKNNFEYKSKSGKLKLNRRINEIIQQQRNIEVLDAATEFASRYTYKQSDGGIMALTATVIKYIKNGFPVAAARIRKNAKGKPNQALMNKIANGLEISGELLFTANMPFINGVANILEKGLEYNPIYGGVKSATYLGLALGSKSDQAKAQELLDKSGEIAYRAILGTLLVVLIQSIGDDDEADGEKAIYGQGDKNFNKSKVIETVRPQNTIRIGGKDVSFDFFGTLSTALKIEAIGKDIKRYADKEVTNSEYFGMLYNQMISASFTKGLSDLQKGTQDVIEKGKTDFFEKKASELLTRVMIPFTSFARQAGQSAKPEAQKVIGFKEQLIKQAGVGGWLINRPNLDYRGRTYETGDLYTSSASGAINLFGAVDKKDPIDIWVLKSTNNNLSISDIKKDTDVNYFMENTDGTSRPMTDLEKYDFSAEQTKVFDKLLNDYYKNKKNEPITPESQEQNAKELSRLNNVSKEAAKQKIILESKNTDNYVKEEFEKVIKKSTESDKEEESLKERDKKNNVSEKLIAFREKLPKDEYTRKLYLAKYLRALTNKQFTLQEWEKASIITSNVAEKEQLLKLAK